MLPLLARRATRTPFGPGGRAVVAETSLWVRRRICEPCFVAVGLLGIVLALVHPDDDLLRYLWTRLAIGFWLIAVAVVLLVQGPLARRAERLALALWQGHATADAGADLARITRLLELVTMVSAVGLPVMLALMVFQPH